MTSRLPGTPPDEAANLTAIAAAHGLTIQGSGDLEVAVTGIRLDNRLVATGEIFAALPGAHTHGARFAAAAEAAGACAILTDAAGALVAADAGLPVLVVATPEELRPVVAAVAAHIHGLPAETLRTFAVTGTNGKTTTSFLMAHVLGLLGRSAGLIGTVELRVGGRAVPARLTTPESPDLQALLADMVEAGDTDLVMEVSSHAIALHRADAVTFDVVGFSHLTPDHLDFHGGIEEYFETKALLFTPEHARHAVVCVDDEWGQRLAARRAVPTTTLSTVPGRAPAAGADWVVSDVRTTTSGSSFVLTGQDARLATSVSLPGDFNVSNAALALVCLLAGGVDAAELQRALDAAGGIDAGVPGRMEQVTTSPRGVVDFAHNTDALGRAIATLRESTPGRVWVVFGATGERDATKRAAMGAIAARLADVVIITDDDPHDEDPATIRAEVAAGARAALAQEPGRGTVVHEMAPRAAAIAAAVAGAAPEDTVLVAGRGHETIQEVAGVDLELDDRAEVRAAHALRPTTQQGTA